ncbi:unnamed protein product [Pelagomonas calceolata]|uniref:Glycosyltransferase 2-like domain-containing protein n=2 Tax=Pelagomonas calceolata TaxID=35677 RepID=A0A8J2S9T9_9STRA|nr:unnamed protein product [Pelagomonas calceolata]
MDESDDESSAASEELTNAAPVECCVDGCTLSVKPSTKCWQLAARYGRFLARAQGLDDDAAPPLVLTRDGKVVPHSTLVSSLAGVELNAVGADGPISRPRPPPPERGDDWRDATSSSDDEDDVAPPPVGPVDDSEMRWRQEASDSPESCWGRLLKLEDVAGDDRDPVCDQLVKALEPLDVNAAWDDRDWLGGTMTLREAARSCSFVNAVDLIVDGYDPATHTPRDAGLQPDFVELPDARDACGMFCVFGYPHVAACVMGQILSKARPTIAWRVVSGMHYACVLGHEYVIDACAAYYEYDAARTLAEDVRNGVFQVVPCFGDGSHATQVAKRVTFKKRSMAHETLTISNRLETLPNRDSITKIRFLFDKEGSGPLADDHDASVPVASPKLWLSKKDEGNQCFRARNFQSALGEYDAALDALRRATKVQLEAVATVLGNRAACHVELDNSSEALADCRAAKAWWSLLGKERLNTDEVKAKRAKLEARRRRLKKAKRAASVILVTDPSKRSYVERVVRCFLAQESSEPLELLVVDDDDGSDGDAPPFWVELMKRDRRIRYVKLPEGTSLGEKRRIACEESRFATLVHFSDDAVYAPSYVSMITELAEAVVCLGAWHCYDTASGRGGFADFDDDALRKTVPPELAQLIKQGVLHGGFGLCYAKKVAERLYPFDRAMDADAAFLKACLDDDDVNVCSVRDAGALCLQVLPGTARTVALTSCSSAYLEASPVGKLVELGSNDAPAKRGLFVWDAEVRAAGDEVAATRVLEAWNRSDAGFS